MTCRHSVSSVAFLLCLIVPTMNFDILKYKKDDCFFSNNMMEILKIMWTGKLKVVGYDRMDYITKLLQNYILFT